MSRPGEGIRASLLDLDPDLGESLPENVRETVRRQLTVSTFTVASGPWPTEANGTGVGLLLVDGIGLRRVRIGDRRTSELLGSGDVLRPWQDHGPHLRFEAHGALYALGPVLVASLDHDFIIRASAFPQVMAEIVGRVMCRSRHLAAALAVAQVPSLQERLLMTLWHLSDRFGRVRSDGVLLPLKLTHEILAELAAAQRPSVTTALGRLRERGIVEATADGYLLRGRPVFPDGALELTAPGPR